MLELVRLFAFDWHSIPLELVDSAKLNELAQCYVCICLCCRKPRTFDEQMVCLEIQFLRHTNQCTAENPLALDFVCVDVCVLYSFVLFNSFVHVISHQMEMEIKNQIVCELCGLKNLARKRILFGLFVCIATAGWRERERGRESKLKRERKLQLKLRYAIRFESQALSATLIIQQSRYHVEVNRLYSWH